MSAPNDLQEAGGAIRPAPDPLADEAVALLHGSLAEAWEEGVPAVGLRERLASRAARSAGLNRTMVNVRRRERVLLEQTPQRVVHELYRQAPGEGAQRPGEPLRVRMVQLSPEGAWLLPAGDPGVGREWLLVRGRALLQTEAAVPLSLGPLDYHVQSAAASRTGACICAGAEGALVLLRERVLRPGDPAHAGESRTVRESPDQWEDYAPLIRRRLLWQDGPVAAMLWLAEPGASVPHHSHGHDEECLMLQGDLFQDDYLLCEGDYQLAPSGSAHESVSTDTGALIYAHGDLQMQIVGL
ncbi:cupin domain-containing protein [Ideonella sp. YS5]|uniref:cupin domain-containing protein n=1 Tax=Ideonella sp. YS5 TaxID=3453714 RepID=UPI003EEBD375